jgi:hypothetical protein
MPLFPAMTIGMSVLASPGRAQESVKGSWECVVEHAAFSPRDTSEGLVYDGKLWLSNAYHNGNVLVRDLWRSGDGANWELVLENTPYDGYSEMVVYKDRMWAIKGSVWTSTDGAHWERVAEKTPFGVRGYGEVVAHQGRIWQLGSGHDVWSTTDGVNWTCAVENAPFGRRYATAVAAFAGKLWLMGGALPMASDPPEKGHKDLTTFNDVWCSEDGATWTRVLEHAPWAPRQWFIAEVYRDRLWIIGGYDNKNHKNFDDVWCTQDGVSWQQLEGGPHWSPRHEPTVYVFQDSLWLVAGNMWPLMNDVWKLTLQ